MSKTCISANLAESAQATLQLYCVNAPYPCGVNNPIFLDNPISPKHLISCPPLLTLTVRSVDVIYNPTSLVSELVISFNSPSGDGVTLNEYGDKFVPYMALAQDPYVSHNGRRFVRQLTDALMDNNYDIEVIPMLVTEGADLYESLVKSYNPEVPKYYATRDRQIP